MTGATAVRRTIDPRTRRRAVLLFAVVAVLGFALDQLTKALAEAYLDPNDPPILFGGLLRLQLIWNPGAAFSIGTQHTWIFTVLSILVLIGIAVLVVPRLGSVNWALGFGLVTAGVLGNVTDRLFRAPGPFVGHVVDFLQLPNFAIFNVADMCVTTAAVLLVVISLFTREGLDGSRTSTEGADAGGSTQERSRPAEGDDR
ncbi:signal peptidase II [Granulicoccus phenolivorans]|uniref:signal peptidase II n=1 Tax=Granulicoccus phenolivorans TaxID=266854 RepID=UPI0004002D85|nr:signal peptidase II [Granulicoccus phenolivorans]